MNRPHDKHGIPVYPGDVLKTFHFVGPRRRKYSLYHVAVEEKGFLFGIPAQDLALPHDGGKFLLSSDALADTEIVEGPIIKEDDKEYFLFTERPRQKYDAASEV